MRRTTLSTCIGSCMHKEGSTCGCSAPVYGELRTFAVERVRRASLQEETFMLIAELDTDPFKHSDRCGPSARQRGPLGFQHPLFDPRYCDLNQGVLAGTRRSRRKDRRDASLVMTMDVCDDYTRFRRLDSQLRSRRPGVACPLHPSNGFQRNWGRQGGRT